MPWRPLPRIAVAVATYPFEASSPADLPLEIGDDLYIIEQGGKDGSWYRGYLVAPPSLLSGLTSGKGQTLEARVFSGIFPRCCVEVREHLGETEIDGETHHHPFNGNMSKIEQQSGSLSRAHRSPVQKNISRLNESEKLLGKQEVGINGDAVSESGASRFPTRSPSLQRSDLVKGHRVARQVSHRSMRSLRPRPSPDPSTPTGDSHPDSTSKRPQAPVPMLKIGDETPTSLSEPLVDEIASCLREWHSKNLHELLLARRYSVLDKISELVERVDLARRQLLHGVLTAQECQSLREETVWNLVNGNKLLSNEIIVRDPNQNGRLLTADDSPFEMSRLQSTMSLLDHSPVFPQDSLNLHHLLVEVKTFAANGLISPTLNLYLCARYRDEGPKPLTETFAIEASSVEAFQSSISTGKLRTLFANLTANEVGNSSRLGLELYLIIKVQASQAVQTIPPITQKASRAEENGKLRPSTGSAGASIRSGRQSLMWAQKQFGSVRSRSQQSEKSSQDTAAPNSSPSPGERPQLTTDESQRSATQQGTQLVKRNVGIGILNLTRKSDRSTVTDHQISIWSPTSTFKNAVEHLEGEGQEFLHELLFSKSGNYAKASNVDHLTVSVQPFAHPLAENLVAETPTLLQNIPITPRIDFSGAPTKPRSDIYITISQANVPVHALLSHPERGTVHLNQTIELRNLQLTLEVRKNSGERIENCIMSSSSSQPLKAWRTTTVERDELWNQMIKLTIPVDDVPQAHIVMSIADAPGFPFGLAWIPLWSEDTFIKDGVHTPILYLYDKATSGKDNGRSVYLDLPWNLKGSSGDGKDEAVTGTLASLSLETKLCSTIFSQDKTLLGILNWRQQSKAQTLSLVKRFSFIPEIEIVKLIGDVLDALFSILVNNTGEEEHEDHVFAALVTTLGIVYDRRFNLERYVDIYAETRFDHPYATPCLIRAYTRLLANHSDAQKARHVRAAFKVGRHILKFILCARQKQKIKEDGIGATTQSAFKRDLKNIFNTFEDLIKDTDPALIGNKTLIVQHMPTWLPELKIVYSEEEILQLACNFIEACKDVQGKLVLYKLVLIYKLSDVHLFTQNHVRSRIIANTVRWIDSYWGSSDEFSLQWREQIRLCCSIVCNEVEEPGFAGLNYMRKAIESYLYLSESAQNNSGSLSLLFPVSYPFPSKPVTSEAKFDEALIELGALLARLPKSPFVQAIDMSLNETVATISDVLDVVNSIISGNALPKVWLSLYVYHHRPMLQILESMLDTLILRFVPPPEEADDFNTDLWIKYLNTLLALVRSDTLALETFPEQKRRAVWKIAGDVREQGAALLRRSWEAIGWDTSSEDEKRYGLTRLGGYQVQYVPSLVLPVVELCLSIHEGLRGVAVKILQSMIISEWTLNEDLSVVQAEIIDSLDRLFKTKDIGNSLVQKMFINETLDAFELLARMPLDPLWQAVRDLVSTLNELLELLAAVHSHDADESMRLADTLQLMNFYKDLQKEDIFICYVHRLAKAQSQLHNKTEAGLALQLHANQYTWDITHLTALKDPVYPQQSSFERKEQLYFGMIKYFEEGAAWDCALASYQELANQYELVHYDFAKLARTQRAMATIYGIIAKGEWQSPRYFRVIYHGLGFPPTLRNRHLIFEGEPWERQSAFIDRMRQLHPSAQILSGGEPDDVEGQYLEISPVSVYRDLEHPIYQQPKVVQSTREYVMTCRPNRFAVTSKRHSPASGVQDQWIEKTIFTTQETFPTILRRSEIIAIDTMRLTPVQTALERASRKTEELSSLEKRVINGDDSGFSNLTEAIISSVDPTSVATVAKYRQLIPQPAEEGEEEEDDDDDDEADEKEEDPKKAALSPLQNALQIAILDHVSTLKHCLTQFSRPSHIGTQASLTDSFHHTFAPEIALLYPNPAPKSDQETSSPPPSSAGALSLTHPPPLTNGTLAQHTEDLSPKNNTKHKSTFHVLKTSVHTQSYKPNGSISAPSEHSSSSFSHNQSNAVPLKPISANATVQNMHDGDRAARGEAENQRPNTSQSLKSASTGRMKKRLSLLGIGRAGSKGEKSKAEGMRVVGEE